MSCCSFQGTADKQGKASSEAGRGYGGGGGGGVGTGGMRQWSTVQMTLNNMGLNCSGPLLRGFL